MDESELEKRIYKMSEDISELLANTNHFYDRMMDAQNDIKEVKSSTKQNEQRIYKAQSDMSVMQSELDAVKEDIEGMGKELHRKEQRQDNDRKALIGTALTVVGIVISFGGFLIKLYGG